MDDIKNLILNFQDFSKMSVADEVNIREASRQRNKNHCLQQAVWRKRGCNSAERFVGN